MDNIVNKDNIYDTKSNFKYEIEDKLKDIYEHVIIETAFVKRFNDAVNYARIKNEMLMIGAHTRNGKSWAIRDLVKSSGRYKSYSGTTIMPVIAIQSPDTNNSNQIVRDLCNCFGKINFNNINLMKNWLLNNIPECGVQQIIIDDAHELNQNHYKFIKWLTDKLILEKNYYISIVFVSIMGNNKISAWQKLTQYQGEDWTQQLYERFSVPYKINGLNHDELTQVLYDYEGIYVDFLPEIKLVPYASNIFGWLTSPKLDIYGSGYVAMAHISKLLYEAARVACIQNDLKYLPLDLLQHVYKSLFILKDTIYQNDETYSFRPKNNNTPVEKNII